MYDWALYGGEDYELLFTAHPAKAPLLQAAVENATGTRVTIIGKVLERDRGCWVVHAGQGSREELQAGGFNHFRG